ncbi:MAG: DPP IV N-terminal domain-containing protein [Bacteroidales bacterium]|nr:DPP IV N-terminal domain-containing protein [Bacteroidales bacterium]
MKHKNTIFPSALLVVLLTLTLSPASAQSKYINSKQLMSRELYPVAPMRSIQFTGTGNIIAYVQDTVLYTGTPGRTRVALTLSKLNNELASADSRPLRTLPTMHFVNDKEFEFNATGRKWLYNIEKKTLSTLVRYDDNVENLDIEPTSHKYAYTKDNSLYIANNGNTHAIVSEKEGIVYGQTVHRNEFGIEKGTFWSPKGTYLAYYRMDESMVAEYPMVNTSTRIASPAPFRYPMAGMKSHEVTIGIYNSVTETETYLQTRRNESVEEHEMYLTNISWSPDERHIYVAKVNRDQNHMWLESYNPTNGQRERVLFEEENERYVEPCEGLYFLPGHNDQFLWFSMRDGYKHLYLYSTNGTLLRQLTSGAYEVEGVIGFDAKGENLFVYANKDNLIGRAAYRVNMKNGEMTLVTCVEGTHTVSVNKTGTCFIDQYSSILTPGQALVLNAKGKKMAELYTLDSPLAEYVMPRITVSTLKAADGKTDLYYRLLTPPNMQPGTKYPTLIYVYGGPHSQLVTDSWLAGAGLYLTYVAEHGYIVFTLDNRGTDNRGFEFESCTHRQLGTVEAADQMEGVKFLQTLPYVDTERMGVEGWSFGGFMTLTLKLTHPEIFKVACAGGPVIDWKWYEVMYGERYMDTPQENPEGYAKASLLDKAKDLQGRLLVIHGAEDNTVVWQNSIEFIERCINAGRQVDYFIYPHHQHNVRGPERVHLYEKMFDYYETHLK